MTMTPTPLERTRAHLVVTLGAHDDRLVECRRQIAALATREDVRPQALVGDLRVYLHRLTELAAVAGAVAAMLENVDTLIAAAEARA